jgi:hypothetical protein
MLTHAQLLDALDYSPETGLFTRKKRTTNSLNIGDIAGGINKKGYVEIRVCGNFSLAHRLAWFYVHGEWPAGHIDHMNGIKDDNRIANLRVLSAAANNENKRRPMAGNTSGLLGVSWMTKAKKWRAQICSKGEVTYLGIFESKDEAHDAYVQAKRSIHIGCTI